MAVGAPYAAAKAASVDRRMTQAAYMPRTLPEYVTWLRAAWENELPSRLHVHDVEPLSALGSPRLHQAFRAYMDAHPMQTDFDPREDLDQRGAARLRPIHAALYQMRQKWPFSAHFVFELAWTGCSWEEVALFHNMTAEVGYRFAFDSLRHLWAIYERDQREVLA